MVFRFADLNIEINSVYPNVQNFCKKYEINEYDHIDFSVTTTDADIDAEISISEKNGAPTSSRKYAESLAVYRKICERILEYDGFLMHGVLLEYDNSGYLFTAKSGVGKTTHAFLWKKAFGEENVSIINGDKPIIRFVDGKVYAYGTPWCGKEGYHKNARVELRGIGFVERCEENSALAIDADVSFPLVLSQIMLIDSANVEKQLELVDTLLNKVSVYRLKCNMDVSAATTAYNEMKKAAQ